MPRTWRSACSPPALGEWIINLGEAAEYMFDHNIFQDNLVGVDFCEQMVKETNPGVLDKGRERPRRRTRACTATHDRRHHAGAESVHRRVLSRSAAHEPLHARDVLPDGRPARASFHALSGRRRHRAERAAVHRLPGAADAVHRVHEEGACRCTTTCSISSTKRCPDTKRWASGACCSAAGARSTIPTHCDYTYKNMNQWGRAMYVTPGVVVDGKAGHHRPGRHQSRASASCWAARSTTTGENERDVRRDRIRWATRSISGIRGIRPPPRSRRSATSATNTPG